MNWQFIEAIDVRASQVADLLLILIKIDNQKLFLKEFYDEET